MKYNLLIWVPVFLFHTVYGQDKKVLDRFSFKTGYSNSVTQWGQSPFSEIRRLDRSISSIFFNLQYAQPVSTNSEIALGVQVMEKGFKTDYYLLVPNVIEQQSYYQYRLHYFEWLLTYIRHFEKNRLILGCVVSVLYANDFRFRETDKVYQNGVETVFDVNYASPYTLDRLNKWDFGLTLGYARQLDKHFDAELTIQKHLVNVDKFGGVDVVYNLCFLLGVRYRFLSYR